MKWLLIAVAVLLVIAITVGVTLFFTRGSGGGTTTPAASDIASANDTGPVAIITVEPTCDSWRPIQSALAASQSDAWGNRDPSIPSSQWTPVQRSQFEAAGTGMRSAADQAVTLARQTPHRVMRELYEQFIAYGRAYADSIAAYKPSDDFLAQTNVSLSTAISSVCDAIKHGEVIGKTAAAPSAAMPSEIADIGDLSKPARFLTKPLAVCNDWVKKTAIFDSNLQAWSNIDTTISADQWTPEQRDLQESAAKTIGAYASDIEALGSASGNGVFADFAGTAALYFQVFANAIQNYTVADSYVVNVGFDLKNVIRSACQASGV
ncbi:MULTISPECIES: hypothetical protein [unclassified Mycobacterium]|uniref:hypothetical protein n=1 Tax=unclassified Mycobacterium TaxID=2642494 RepID=UPI0029C9A67D|nr:MULTISPECIES: hypothetical protein [unclassified Mycobacterium]